MQTVLILAVAYVLFGQGSKSTSTAQQNLNQQQGGSQTQTPGQQIRDVTGAAVDAAKQFVELWREIASGDSSSAGKKP